ncbi:MAG: hypothetical protein ACM3SY_04560 [Candidatus Omnitrophota bacterium]
MNLNRKPLAIGLSIAAVLIVGYQVFFNKPDKPTPAVSQGVVSAPTLPAAAPGGSPPQPLPSNGRKNGEGLEIDYNSPLLLTAITAEATQPFPKSELPAEFGGNLFAKPVEQLSANEPVYEREIEFKLNAIIIDDHRRLAIINDKIVRIGDLIQGAQVVDIVKSQVTLKGGNDNVVLSTNSRIKKIKLAGGKGEK